MTTDTKFDLEDYCTFLAANLMGGPSKIKQKFDSVVESKSPNKSFSLYWKSPLLVEIITDPFVSAPTTTTDEAATSDSDDDDNNLPLDLVFLDATFHFQATLAGQDDNKAGTSVSVAFGACLCRRGTREYFYLRNKPVTELMLHDHVDQHHIVLEETRSHVIARQMAEAFLDLEQRTKPISVTNVVLEEDSQNNIRIQKVEIPLRYENGTEISHFSIVDSDGSVAKMASNVASMMFSNIRSHDETKKRVASQDDDEDDKETELLDSKSAMEVKQSQQEWANAAMEGLEAEEEARKARLAAAAQGDKESNPNNGPKTSTTTQDKDTSSKPKAKKAKVRHGMMRLAAPATKKRAKTGFSNPFGPPKKK